MKKILAAIDFSPTSSEALRVAEELTAACEGQLWLVHVAAPDPGFVGYDVGPQTVRDSRAHMLHKEHGQLQKLASALRMKGLDTLSLLIQGPTVKKILEEAERLEVDTIVIGSHGHGTFMKMLLGSVSGGVLKASKIPVMIVPSPA